MAFINRRKQMRVVLNSDIYYAVAYSAANNLSADEWVKAELYDMSGKGLSLRVKHCLVTGETILIQIAIGQKKYKFTAQVMNGGGQRAGVKFVHTDNENMTVIADFIETELKKRRQMRNIRNPSEYFDHFGKQKIIKRYKTSIAT